MVTSAILLVAAAQAGAARAPVQIGAVPSQPATVTPSLSATEYAGGLHVTLTGDPLTASPFTSEQVSTIPFGRWLNGMPFTEREHGSEFSAQLVNCSAYGCIVELDTAGRVLVAHRDIADGIRLDIYDDGWSLSGSAAVSDAGMVAIPMTGPGGQREIWLIRRNGLMHKRIPVQTSGPVLIRWRNEEELFMIHQDRGGMELQRIAIGTEEAASATLMEAYWDVCAGGTAGRLSAGPLGESPDELRGYLSIPVYRRGDAVPGVLELTQSARPMTTGGYSSPVRVRMDCAGRINIVSALGDDVWCLRFGQDGKITNAQKISANLSGDFKSVLVDQHGSFWYLEVEIDQDTRRPMIAHLFRLK
jgi:hypothetical protein